jgi:hypothetical protein
MEPHQTDLFGLFPGAPGGRSLAGQRGSNYFRTFPATIISWDGVTYRRIPYWPPRSTRRRPIFVRIEVGNE